MWKNYVKVSFRNLLKYKSFSIINIVGLSIGIATSILIFLFVQYEFSYEDFYENKDRIFRIGVDARIGNTEIHQTGTPSPMPAAMYAELPDIEKITRIFDLDETTIEIQQEKYFEKDIFFVDSAFFEMFTLDIINGQKTGLLNEAGSAVITKSFADKYFKGKDPLNKIIGINVFDTTISPKIVAIVEDIPHNSHFHSNIFISMLSTPAYVYSNNYWFWNMFTTYIMLKPNVNYLDLEAKLPQFIRKNHLGNLSDEQFAERTEQGDKWNYFLQPLPSIHLNSNLNGEYEANGNETYVKIFILIAFFILLIASINFMNLSTAKSANRAKEVGIRKVSGATKTGLMRQFLVESVVISLIALILGMVIIESILPYYRNLIDKPLGIQYFNNVKVIPSLIILAVVIGIFSGLYPGLVLSQYRPIAVLKSSLVNGKRNSWFRNVLVIFQFSIAIILIVGTIVIDRQVKLVQNKNLGFNKEQVLIVKNVDVLSDKFDVFKNSLQANSNIQTVSYSNSLPGKNFSNIGFGAEDVEESFTLNLTHCDYDFLDVLNLEMVQGRFFSKNFRTDSSAIVINEAALELLEYENPIGKKLNNWSEDRDEFHIVGVYKDYHYESMHTKIRPQALVLFDGIYPNTPDYASCRLRTDNIQETINFASEKWDELSNRLPFKYSFLNNDYDALYDNEEQTKILFTIFSFLAIFIACLGILGLASFIAQQKTKEIGIRKVHGALVENIFVLLSKQFTKWVLIANIIAWPVAWYFMRNWLQNFTYQTEIAWWYFIVAGLLAFFIALATVSFQSIHKSRMNPIEALRYE